MKLCPLPPRSSAIGPLATTSYAERSMICLHCQKVHNSGFIWNFSETVRVCFTCYREMGEAGRMGYERDAARDKSKKVELQTRKHPMKVIGILALLIVILGVSAYFFYKPLIGGVAEPRVRAGEGWRGK